MTNTQTNMVTTFNHIMELDAAAIRTAFGLPSDAEIIFNVPTGGDWSGMTICISEKNPVTALWSETKVGSPAEIKKRTYLLVTQQEGVLTLHKHDVSARRDKHLVDIFHLWLPQRKDVLTNDIAGMMNALAEVGIHVWFKELEV